MHLDRDLARRGRGGAVGLGRIPNESAIGAVGTVGWSVGGEAGRGRAGTCGEIAGRAAREVRVVGEAVLGGEGLLAEHHLARLWKQALGGGVT